MKAAELRTSLLPRSGEPSPATSVPTRSLVPDREFDTATRPRSPSVPPVPSELSDRALFQVNSVVGQVWLVQLRKRIQAGYRRLNSGRPACLQAGYAWRSFSTFFEPLSAIEIVRLFENLLQFANFEDCPPAQAFFLSYAPLAFEHDLGGEYIGPGVWSPPSGSGQAARRVRRSLQRWCDWLEALTHFQVHGECRQAAASPDLEKAVILLWPLVKRHNWNWSELLGILRSQANCSERPPCESEAQLAAFCQTSLGLHCRRAPGEPARVPLPGEAVAARLIKFLPLIN